jgi:hypothetical protein
MLVLVIVWTFNLGLIILHYNGQLESVAEAQSTPVKAFKKTPQNHRLLNHEPHRASLCR